MARERTTSSSCLYFFFYLFYFHYDAIFQGAPAPIIQDWARSFPSEASTGKLTSISLGQSEGSVRRVSPHLCNLSSVSLQLSCILAWEEWTAFRSPCCQYGSPSGSLLSISFLLFLSLLPVSYARVPKVNIHKSFHMRMTPIQLPHNCLTRLPQLLPSIPKKLVNSVTTIFFLLSVPKYLTP